MKARMNKLTADIIYFTGEGKGLGTGHAYGDAYGDGKDNLYLDMEYGDCSGEGCGEGFQNGHGRYDMTGVAQGFNAYHKSVGERE